MLTIWTNKKGRTREGLIAEKGKIIEGRPYKKDNESFRGGVIFGDLPTSLVYSLSAQRLFLVEPVGERTKILLDTEPIKTEEIRILGIKIGKEIIEENKIYGKLWKAPKVRIVRELNAVTCLRSLFNHPDFWVKKVVAEATQETVLLQTMSLNDNGLVLAGVANNPNTDKYTIGRLSHCPDPLVRAIAIRRSDLSVAALEEIQAKEIDALVRMVLEQKLKPHRQTPFFTKVKMFLLGY